MSYFTYIAFPRELKAFRLSDIKGREKEFGIHYDTSRYRKDIVLFPGVSPEENCIVIADRKDATFKNCFKNSYIYEFYIDYRRNERLEDTVKTFYKLEGEERAIKQWALYCQILSGFILQNISLGEFVEIYKEFTDHVNFNLGPPNFEYEVELKNLLLFNYESNTTESHKLTISYNIPI